MLFALQCANEVDNPFFRLGYNSLGAFGTINHLHFQGYFLEQAYPVERAPTEPVARLPDKVCTLAPHVLCFAYQLTCTFTLRLMHDASRPHRR